MRLFDAVPQGWKEVKFEGQICCEVCNAKPEVLARIAGAIYCQDCKPKQNSSYDKRYEGD